MQYYLATRTRSFLSSSGFGTMGYGLPAAIGAKVACPERQVFDIDGDGSLNMTIHELSTCHRYGIGVKVVVINNQWLGMVRQWQDMIYGGHRACTDLSDPMMTVKRQDDIDVYPDFVALARGYRVSAERVTDKTQLAEAFTRLLADPDEPYLLDVIVAANENVYPMISAGASYREIIMVAEDLNTKAKDQQGSSI
jgi:acetolactate synthase-1/2/3 large subunit